MTETRSPRTSLLAAALLLSAGVLVIVYAARSTENESSDPDLASWARPLEGPASPGARPRRISRLRDSAEMIWVSEATCDMGPLPDDEHAWEDEGKRRRVEISGFYVDVHEVTLAQFRAFVDETGYVSEAVASGPGFGFTPDGADDPLDMIDGLNWEHCNPCRNGPPRDRHPVSCVTWRDAWAYAQWVGASLPTEAEFEYLLGFDARESAFPWGNSPSPPRAYANVLDESFARAFPRAAVSARVGDVSDGYIGTAPVQSFAPNSIGLSDLCGNVAEWCLNEFHAPLDSGNFDPGAPERTGVLRGGSWFSNGNLLRTARRQSASRTVVRAYMGFRCVWRPSHRKNGAHDR